LTINEEIKSLSLTEAEYARFLKSRDAYRPTLCDLNRALDDTIVGEYKTRLSVCTSFVLAKIPVYVSGPSFFRFHAHILEPWENGSILFVCRQCAGFS
jgi:hypothetical protein